PMKYVKKVKTPILLIHSEEDHRCPIEQAEQFYIAIKILNKADTKFIRYPNESHELSRSGRPDRRIHRLEATLGWFEKY
ncbi:MAG TPA: S9 family peptidase, partial [Trueperaceae bacterium]|nr:S9 family peptidase [Trueperaceae bacterium]